MEINTLSAGYGYFICWKLVFHLMMMPISSDDNASFVCQNVRFSSFCPLNSCFESLFHSFRKRGRLLKRKEWKQSDEKPTVFPVNMIFVR